MKIRRSIEFKAKPDALVVRDIISFKLMTGEKVKARAIKREGNRLLMWFEDCLKTRYSMNEENTNEEPEAIEGETVETEVTNDGTQQDEVVE